MKQNVLILLAVVLFMGFGPSFANDKAIIDSANDLISSLEKIDPSILPLPVKKDLKALISMRDHVLVLQSENGKLLSNALNILNQKTTQLGNKSRSYIKNNDERLKKIELSLQCDYRPRVPPIEILFGKSDQEMFGDMLVPLLNEHWLPALEASLPASFTKYFQFSDEDISNPKAGISALDHAAGSIHERLPKWLMYGEDALSEGDIRHIVNVFSPDISDESKMPDGVQITIKNLKGKFQHINNKSPTVEFISDQQNSGGLLAKVTMPSVSITTEGDLDLVLMDESNGKAEPMKDVEQDRKRVGQFRLSTSEIPISIVFRTRSPVVEKGSLELMSIEIGDNNIPTYSLDLRDLPAYFLKVNINGKPTVINLAEEGVADKVKGIVENGWSNIIQPEINSKVAQFAEAYLIPIIDEVLLRVFKQKIPIKTSWPKSTTISSPTKEAAEGPFIVPYSRPTLLKTDNGSSFMLEQVQFRVIDDPEAGEVLRLSSKIEKENVKMEEKFDEEIKSIGKINENLSSGIKVTEHVCFNTISESDQLVCSVGVEAGYFKEGSGVSETVMLPLQILPASLVQRDISEREGTQFYLPEQLINITLEEAWLGFVEPQWKREGIRRIYEAIYNEKGCQLEDMPQFREWLDEASAKIIKEMCQEGNKSVNEGNRKRLMGNLYQELLQYRIVPTDFSLGDRTLRLMSAPRLSFANASDGKSVDATIRGFISDITSGSVVHKDLIDASLSVRLTPTEEGVLVTYLPQSAELEIYKPLLNLFLFGNLNNLLSDIVDRKLDSALGEKKR